MEGFKVNRILTLQVEITDKEKSAWIWDNHSGKDTNNGVYVQAIQEGKIPEENYDENQAD